ncbi:unnamed protein product [Clonostachys rosea f. rosea IK726]|uniref:Uncharacterized protein n=1 Tax=Clonostachys rosea f. rosea IK726 TaxID=1349383 RepID=A0ACA9T8U4_BIOOC|nr:unnamed protein product [Clonostachys rosea f. rosea IK726]
MAGTFSSLSFLFLQLPSPLVWKPNISVVKSAQVATQAKTERSAWLDLDSPMAKLKMGGFELINNSETTPASPAGKVGMLALVWPALVWVCLLPFRVPGCGWSRSDPKGATPYEADSPPQCYFASLIIP